MGKETLLETLKYRTLIGDGAMGTQLMLAGLEQGNCGEVWNIEHPEKILEIQKRYVDAGSDCIITNTFGGCAIMLKRHGFDGEVAAINIAACEIAREAFGDKTGFVLGDMGPFGGIMEPYGDISEDVVRAALLQQAKALVAGGVDAIIIETQTSYEEMGVAIEVCKEAGAPCIIGSMAYDVTTDGETFRTMMGIDPEPAALFMQEKGADIIALNCGTGMNMQRAKEATERYKSVCDLFVMTQANAGLPVLENMKVVYKETPEEMVSGFDPLYNAGANIIGGCCGSTPDHIRLFKQQLEICKS
jgi:5-methyltetrahydrofolate--homocysteine methyltransferase